MILGAHVSTAGGVSNAPANAHNLGISSFQVFTSNQNRWNDKPLDPIQITTYLKNRSEYGIKKTFAHDSYLINLCAADHEKLEKSRIAFLDEIDRADALGMDGLVFHPGSHLGTGEEQGLNLISESLKSILDKRPESKIKLLIETTAGQGTNLGYRFEHIAEIINRVDRPGTMGVCIDTCHIYAAGYDFTTQEGYNKVITEFDEIVGLDKLFAVHINDSKKQLGSRVDRHDNIGGGFIGLAPFGYWLNDKRLADIPAILETPGNVDDYRRNLDLLESLVV